MSLGYDGILEYINQLPEYDDPIVFGMNNYAENLLWSQRADQLIESMFLMEPRKPLHTHGYVVLKNKQTKFHGYKGDLFFFIKIILFFPENRSKMR